MTVKKWKTLKKYITFQYNCVTIKFGKTEEKSFKLNTSKIKRNWYYTVPKNFF